MSEEKPKAKAFQPQTLMGRPLSGSDEFGDYRTEGGIKFYKKYSEKMLSKSLRFFINSQIKLSAAALSRHTVFNYLEFGVYNGRAAHSFANFLAARGDQFDAPLRSWHFHLFDSWSGLPPQRDDADKIGVYREGDYASIGPGFVTERLKSAGVCNDHIHTYAGWFANLSEDARQQVEACGGVTAFACFDCDYYSSTREALNWAEPLLRTGTALYFDDVLMYFGSKNKGQLRAIHEFNEQRECAGLFLRSSADSEGRIYSYWNDNHIEAEPEAGNGETA